MSHLDYHMNECVLRVPAGFVDRSVNILEWTLASGEKLALIVQRQHVDQGVSLEAIVEEETREYAAKFVAYHLDRDEVEAEGPVAVRRKVFRFKKEQDVFHNHQLFILDGAQLILVSASARAHHRGDVDQVVDECLAGLRLREP